MVSSQIKLEPREKESIICIFIDDQIVRPSILVHLVNDIVVFSVSGKDKSVASEVVRIHTPV